MARTFTAASSHRIQFSVGLVTSAWLSNRTIVMLVKVNTNAGTTTHALFGSNYATDILGGLGIGVSTAADRLHIMPKDGVAASICQASTITLTTTDGWALVACGKGSGTVTPRFHKYVYSSNAFTHEDGA